MSETCSTCRFFHVKRIKDREFPKCRRFPVEAPVAATHWCGEWKRYWPDNADTRTADTLKTIPPATADGPGVGQVETGQRGKRKK